MAVRFTGAQGVELAADLLGRWDDPLVVLLHGGGQTRFSWGATADALADRPRPRDVSGLRKNLRRADDGRYDVFTNAVVDFLDRNRA